jgi:aspartate carbamoyltransferase catalytic subunit
MEVTASSKRAKPSRLLPSSSWSGRQHLLDTKDLTLPEVSYLLDQARKYKRQLAAELAVKPELSGKTVANLFYENSTRTRCSFELASKNLGMHVLNLDLGTSSVKKGETLEDTARTLLAMGVHVLVQRHASSGSAELLAKVTADRAHVINAGDGANAHPTQALLDLFTMLEFKEDLKGAKIAIVGDVLHSRVARSNFWLLQKLGAHIHFAGPPALMPSGPGAFTADGGKIHSRLEDALEGADFVMALRLQLERQQSGLISSLEEYAKRYRLDHKRLSLAQPTVKVMHPGPINRGIEITDAVADDPALSLIERQVANGIPVRMGILRALCLGK